MKQYDYDIPELGVRADGNIGEPAWGVLWIIVALAAIWFGIGTAFGYLILGKVMGL